MCGRVLAEGEGVSMTLSIERRCIPRESSLIGRCRESFEFMSIERRCIPGVSCMACGYGLSEIICICIGKALVEYFEKQREGAIVELSWLLCELGF